MKSLRTQNHPLSSALKQLEILDRELKNKLMPFRDNLASVGLFPLKPTGIEIFQLNVGKQCNQTCKHCHVDAGPDRKEKMTREMMEVCLRILEANNIPVVDITGGAPEMHPDFRWFVEECSKLGKQIIVRCNLTIILANNKYYDLPQFFRDHRVEVVSSLPFYNADRTDRQRGEGVFEKSIIALKMLNDVGYGLDGSDLKLNLVYNPTGALLPGSQSELEFQFKRILLGEHNVHFNNLYTITNMPVSRFLDYLLTSGNYEKYMSKLVEAFNVSAAKGVMCRNTISIGWDGSIYDCDFNQMLELKVDPDAPQHIMDFDLKSLNEREIVTNQHCYGCTAGAGSSCGGATT
jgi:radical SAM/Cys-rich protein